MTPTRRAASIERLEALARGADPGASATCFEILYGLPADTQVAAAAAAMRRFLPHYERARPGPPAAAARRALDDPRSWLRDNRRASPLGPDPAPLAESAFAMGFDGLLLACAFGGDDPYALTSGCAYAIRKAVDARADAVWVADEPGLLDAFNDGAGDGGGGGGAPGGRPGQFPNPYENVAWVAVAGREWRAAADWLRRRPDVRDAADDVDPARLAAELDRWLAHEEIAVVPARGRHGAGQAPGPKPIDWGAVDARVEARLARGDPTPLEQMLGQEVEREQHAGPGQ